MRFGEAVVVNTAVRLRRMPMLRAAAVLAAGIFIFDRFLVPRWLLWVLFAVSCGFAAFVPHAHRPRWLVIFTVFVFGGVVAGLHRRPSDVPLGRPVVAVVAVDDVPAVRTDGRVSAPVRILSFDDGSGTRPSRCRAMMWSDGSFDFSFGDRLTLLTELRPFREERTAYFNLMTRRGFAGTLFAVSADTLAVSHDDARRSVHAAAVERFSRLKLHPSVAAVAGAMSTGDRSRMTPELREAYSRSGVSHILAVSGLHIGIVFLLANALCRLLTLFRHGQIAACAAVLIPVWLYAAACGFPPSVIRAAVMFTLLQLSAAASSEYFPMNTLPAAAFIMLTFDPDALFDISFQLSFAAVAAIVTVGKPLFRLADRRTLAGRFLWDTFVIGVLSFAAAAPLVSHTFGRLSLAGVLVNPVVLLCAYVIVAVSVLWVCVPLPFVQPAAEWILDLVAGLQNTIVERLAAYEWLSFDFRLPTAAVVAVYAVMVLSVPLVWGLEEPMSERFARRKVLTDD